jgi:hypothetical protein
MINTLETQTYIYYLKAPAKVYLCFIYLLLAIMVFCVATMPIEIFQQYSFYKLGAWLCGLSMTVFFAYATIPAWKIRLELSPEGVTYTNPTYYRIYTPWENIELIARLSRFRQSASFILRTPATINIKFLEGQQHHLAVIERCSILATKIDLQKQPAYFIPLMALVPKRDLENGAFKIYLQQYAPHLSYD